MFMGYQLTRGILGSAALTCCLGLYAWFGRELRLAPQEHQNLGNPSSRYFRDGLFPTVQQEQEANRIYHEQQNAEYAALQGALDISQWQEAIAVQFDVRDDPSAQFTHRHRLIWDLFSPFYNCPLQQRVGSPKKLYDGGKWICGVQQLLQVCCLSSIP